MSDGVCPGGVLASSVDEQSVGEVKRRGVGEQLVEVGVRDTLDLGPLVLAVSDETASIVLPPRQIGCE